MVSPLNLTHNSSSSKTNLLSGGILHSPVYYTQGTRLCEWSNLDPLLDIRARHKQTQNKLRVPESSSATRKALVRDKPAMSNLDFSLHFTEGTWLCKW